MTKFEDFVNKLQEIRELMRQEEITCELEGNRTLIISENQPPEYLGPEFDVGSIELFPTSDKISELKKIMDTLPGLRIIRMCSI